ncbi:hypothetical protein D3C75_1381580 [compost metagenome]
MSFAAIGAIKSIKDFVSLFGINTRTFVFNGYKDVVSLYTASHQKLTGIRIFNRIAH